MQTITIDPAGSLWDATCSECGLLGSYDRDFEAADRGREHTRDAHGRTRPQTEAESRLEAGITTAGVLLDSREYVKLEALLSKLALDARSLALLGPEGAQSIPVSHTVGSRIDSIVEFEIGGVKRYGLTARGLEALGRPDLAAEQKAEAWGRTAAKSITNRVRVNGPTGITREGVTLSTPRDMSPTIRVVWPGGQGEDVERRYVTWLEDDAPVGAGDSVEADRG